MRTMTTMLAKTITIDEERDDEDDDDDDEQEISVFSRRGLATTSIVSMMV